MTSTPTPKPRASGTPLEIRALREGDNRISFRSGDADLDCFFQQFAGQNQFRHHLGVTYVAVDDRDILGFATVAAAHLERYSDFANRLPRGRTYVRNGSVVDLRIAPGVVTALVSGSDIYKIEMKVAAVPATRWRAICKDCAGAIDSVVELLQGKLSQGVMARMCQAKTGLFPSPKEITFSCSCPDWASMCKHIAAVLYGIGARLDEQPELLFLLRQVDQQALVAKAGSDLSRTRKVRAGKVLDAGDLSEIFGIEMVSHAKRAPRPPGHRADSRGGGNVSRQSDDELYFGRAVVRFEVARTS